MRPRRTYLLLLVSCLLAAAPAPTSAAAAPWTDWPTYGADQANTRSNPSGPTPTQAATLTQAWKFNAANGDFTGTPVVGGGRVFVGSNGGEVDALSATTGARLWTRQLDAGINSSGAFDRATGHLYFGVARVGSPYVIALDAASGQVLWRTVVTTQPGSDIYASPALVEGDVVIGTSALSSELHDSAPTARGSLARISGRSGAVMWRRFTVAPGLTGGAIWSSAAFDPASRLLYVGTGNAYQPPADPHTDSILAVDFNGGRIVRFFQATPNDVWNATTQAAGRDYDFGASPDLFTLADGTPVVGEGQKSGVYWLFRRSDLQPLWSTRVGTGSPVGGILGSTAVGGGRIYGPVTAPGAAWSLNADGSIAWLEPGPEFGPFAYSNGVVYALGSEGFLQVFNAANGVPILQLPLGAPAFGGVSVSEGMVFANSGTQGSQPGSVIALRTP